MNLQTIYNHKLYFLLYTTLYCAFLSESFANNIFNHMMHLSKLYLNIFPDIYVLCIEFVLCQGKIYLFISKDVKLIRLVSTITVCVLCFIFLDDHQILQFYTCFQILFKITEFYSSTLVFKYYLKSQNEDENDRIPS